MQSILMKRLDDLSVSLSHTEGAIALIGLGSVGVETDRIDEYSDIDFFVIVKNGMEKSFIQDTSWLSDVYPISYIFQNTKDGYKVLFDDGVYGEFAVFDEKRLPNIPFYNARLHWRHPDSNFVIQNSKYPLPKQRDLDFAFNEALTNIYVGLLRYLRGEYYSALLFIQNYALNQVASVLHYIEGEQATSDIFDPSRRIEIRYPAFSSLLPKILVGYKKTPDAAKVLLAFMSTYYDLNFKMVSKIEKLIEKADKKNGIE